MGRGTPGYSTAHLLPLGQKPTSAGPASSCAATHAHPTTQASSIDQHSAVQEPQPQQCLQHLEKNHLEKNQWRRTKMADIKMPTTSTKTNGLVHVNDVPARRCRRLLLPRMRPTRLGQARRRTLRVLRPRNAKIISSSIPAGEHNHRRASRAIANGKSSPQSCNCDYDQLLNSIVHEMVGRQPPQAAQHRQRGRTLLRLQPARTP